MLPSIDNSRVVLIGASQFTDPALSRLPAVRDNLTGLAECLQNPQLWGLPAERCVQVSDPSSVDALIDPIHEAATQATDTLIIYYAGHGLLDHDTNELLLAVVGTRLGRTHTAVPYEYVRRDVSLSRASRRVVILDCCYSGKALGAMAAATSVVADQASIAGTYVLASTPPHRPALSPPGAQYTAFTGEFISVLVNGLADASEFLTMDMIYNRLLHAARSGPNPLPEPQKRGGNTVGDLALVRNRLWHPNAEKTKALESHERASTRASRPEVESCLEPTSRSGGKPLLGRRRLLVGLTGVAALAGAAALISSDLNDSGSADDSHSANGSSSDAQVSTPPYRVLIGHTEPVWGVAFTTDGTMLATCGADATIRLWDVHSGTKVGALYGHVGAVWGLSFNRTSTVLASSGADQKIWLWETASHQPLFSLTGHTDWIETLAFSPIWNVLASGSYDGTVRLWDTETGKGITTLTEHNGPVLAVAFNPAGDVLATVGEDQVVHLWDAKTHRLVRTLTGHTGAVWGVAFSPDGVSLATSSADRTVRIWRTATGEPLATLNGHSDNAVKVAYRPAGDWLASSSDDWTSVVWEVASSRQITVLDGHKGPVIGVAFHPVGTLLATASTDKTVRLWDLGNL